MSASGDGEGDDDVGERDENVGGEDEDAGEGDGEPGMNQPPNGGDRSEPAGPVDLLVNPGEGRLRAGWRVVGWMFVLVLASTAGLAVQGEFLALAPDGLPAALAATAGGVGLYAVVTAATVVYAWRVDHRSATGFGLGGKRFGPDLAVGLGLGLAMATVVFVVATGLDAVRVVDTLVVDPAASVVPGGTVGDVAVGGLDPPVVIALLLAFFVAVGVAEEVLVRGYLLTNVAEGLRGLGPIDERRAIAIAVLATGGLFGALHYANPHAGVRSAATITAVGVVLGWTYAVSGDLGIPIGVHVTWNFALGAVYGFPVSGLSGPASLVGIEVTGDPLVMGGSFGPEAGLVMVAPLVVAVVATVLWVRRTTGDLSLQTGIARFERE